MKRILLFSLLIVVASAQGQVTIGIKGCYMPGTYETPINPSSIDLEQYDKVRIHDVQSYINKLIVSPQTKTFFSFILADTPEVIQKKLTHDKKMIILEKNILKTDSTDYHFYKIKNETGMLMNKVIYKQPELSNSIMVDAIFKRDEDWSAFYKAPEQFVKQLSCVKK